MTEFRKNGGAYITSLIGEAVRDGSRRVTLSGCYEIEQTVLIPSDFTLILENCHLRQAEGTFCNIFTNENCRTTLGRTPEGTDRNIRIIGVGKAILDGGVYNGLSERNYDERGMSMYVNNLLLFANVEGFEISGLQAINQRWWAFCFCFCGQGRIANIDFCSDPRSLLPDGSFLPYLDVYEQAYIKNSDGIDLRIGCHDILIENITGFTEDDTIALTALTGKSGLAFDVEGKSRDIRNVIIRNVRATAFCAIVRLLNQGEGTRMYNILIDGVMDTTYDCPYVKHPAGRAIRLGCAHRYGNVDVTPESFFNITVRNVWSCAKHVVLYDPAIANMTLDNINGFGENQAIATSIWDEGER